MLRSSCLACEKGVPKRGRRRCPLCQRVFRSGWEGVDAHWRAHHEAALGYARFWASLCRAHRAPRALECPSCRKGIPRSRKWPRQCPECAQVFTGREGKQVPVAETVRGFKEILDGKHDEVAEQSFYMKGGIEEILETAPAGKGKSEKPKEEKKSK